MIWWPDGIHPGICLTSACWPFWEHGPFSIEVAGRCFETEDHVKHGHCWRCLWFPITELRYLCISQCPRLLTIATVTLQKSEIGLKICYSQPESQHGPSSQTPHWIKNRGRKAISEQEQCRSSTRGFHLSLAPGTEEWNSVSTEASQLVASDSIVDTCAFSTLDNNPGAWRVYCWLFLSSSKLQSPKRLSLSFQLVIVCPQGHWVHWGYLLERWIFMTVWTSGKGQCPSVLWYKVFQMKYIKINIKSCKTLTKNSNFL